MYPSSLPQNKPPLQPAAFLALSLGVVRPRGWLFDQLRLQADGIRGHLDEYWPDAGAASGWLGSPGDDLERAPYYCDGLLLQWRLVDNSAGEIDGGSHDNRQPLEQVTLIPYGTTTLRVATFPLVRR